jgi:hypothetical protein
VQDSERAVDDVAGKVAGWENSGMKDGRRDDEGEEHKAAEPEDEREEHEEAES